MAADSELPENPESGGGLPDARASSTGATESFQTRIEVVNSQGLHARPASRVVQLANTYPCRLLVAKGDLEVDAKSIMSLMMLGAEQGSSLTIRGEGEKARDAVEALVQLFASGFGER